MNLIHLYGEFWNPDAVEWGAPGKKTGGNGNKGTLRGKVKTGSNRAATLHWNMFSWYSTSSLREKTVRVPGARQIKLETVVGTLEAFAIAIASPPLNRRHDLPGARPVEQANSRHPHTVRHYLENILRQVEKSAPTPKKRK